MSILSTSPEFKVILDCGLYFSSVFIRADLTICKCRQKLVELVKPKPSCSIKKNEHKETIKNRNWVYQFNLLPL